MDLNRPSRGELYPHKPLTPTQEVIMKTIIATNGRVLTGRQLAKALNMRETTLRTHKQNIIYRMGTNSITSAVIIYMKEEIRRDREQEQRRQREIFYGH